MKKFIAGFIVGAVVSGGITYYITKEIVEAKTINDLKEELLASCMKEAEATVSRGLRAEKKVMDEAIPEETLDIIKEATEETTKEEYEKITKNYRNYYETEDETNRDPDVVAEECKIEKLNMSMEELSKKHKEMCKSTPYELCTFDEFEDSEWIRNELYSRETLKYHIPDEAMTDDVGNVLAYEDVIDMLGPEFERELCDRGRVFVRNHIQETEYEVYSTDISIQDLLGDDESDDDEE